MSVMSHIFENLFTSVMEFMKLDVQVNMISPDFKGAC